MPAYRQCGEIPRKRHIALRRDPGHKGEGIAYEEVVTLSGFSRAYSIVYHLRPPTRVLAVEPAGSRPIEFAPADRLRHVHMKSAGLPRRGDLVSGRVPVLANDDVLISRCKPQDSNGPLYRNAAADEVIFVHRGRGVLRSMFGELPIKPYDYAVVPVCTTYQVDWEAGSEPDLLVIEASGSITIPTRYLNADGQIRLGAPYSERDFHGPTFSGPIDREGPHDVLVKDGARLTRYRMAHHPFDLVGWDGMLYPYTFNADDFEPITGTVHQPPPVHQTFDGPGFVVCTFAPRMLDTHPEAIKVPYAHSNVHADEVLYYVRGRFGSRRGVEEGSFTLHPRGIPHGPHPGTIVASKDVTRTDELAVMVDTFRPLKVTAEAAALDDPNYPLSWIDA